MDKLLISSNNNKIFLVKVFDGKVVDTLAFDLLNRSILGNIYVGKVTKIVKDNFAFVNINHSKNAFININDKKEEKVKNVKEGDDILVQVVRDATDNKGPAVTSEIVIKGENLMIVYDYDKKIGVSKKILSKNVKKRLKKLGEKFSRSVIFRTEAEFASEEDILLEYDKLLVSLEELIEKHKYHLAPKLLVDQNKDGGIFKRVEEFSKDVETIFLCDENLYNDLKDTSLNEKLVLQKTNDIFCEHFVRKQVDEIFQKKVWLKSGGFIIIEYTEAFVIIDVNSGKNIKEKDKDQLSFNTNREAIVEIFNQIKLRNLSGIILVDLIDMKKSTHKDEILSMCKNIVKLDTDYTIHGLTSLGILEITKKKRSDPIYKTLN